MSKARKAKKEERKPKFTVVGGSGDPPQGFIRAVARLLLDVADKQIAEERRAAESAGQVGRPNSSTIRP
jgi:hypothetical protein